MNEQVNAVAAPSFGAPLAESDVLLTGDARVKLKELLDSEEDIDAIRVFVAGGGCGGMTYGMTFTDTMTEFDRALIDDGLKVYIDAVALNYLSGVEIDFKETPTGGSFVFNNVFQATGGSGTCGTCGAVGGGCA